jgi:hypothetical protein
MVSTAPPFTIAPLTLADISAAPRRTVAKIAVRMLIVHSQTTRATTVRTAPEPEIAPEINPLIARETNLAPAPGVKRELTPVL